MMSGSVVSNPRHCARPLLVVRYKKALSRVCPDLFSPSTDSDFSVIDRLYYNIREQFIFTMKTLALSILAHLACVAAQVSDLPVLELPWGKWQAEVYEQDDQVSVSKTCVVNLANAS